MRLRMSCLKTPDVVLCWSKNRKLEPESLCRLILSSQSVFEAVSVLEAKTLSEEDPKCKGHLLCSAEFFLRLTPWESETNIDYVSVQTPDSFCSTSFFIFKCRKRKSVIYERKAWQKHLIIRFFSFFFQLGLVDLYPFLSSVFFHYWVLYWCLLWIVYFSSSF